MLPPPRASQPLHGINENFYDRFETREFSRRFDTKVLATAVQSVARRPLRVACRRSATVPRLSTRSHNA